MADEGEAGSLTRSIRRLTHFILALAGLAAALVAVNADWTKLKDALFSGHDANGATNDEQRHPGPAPTATQPGGCVPNANAAWSDSNDCYVAYQNGEIARAESLCNRGLVEARCANRKDIEGMVYFNLGLCAETRSDWRSAQQLYRSSLAARPGNAKVEARLDTVSTRLGSASN